MANQRGSTRKKQPPPGKGPAGRPAEGDTPKADRPPVPAYVRAQEKREERLRQTAKSRKKAETQGEGGTPRRRALGRPRIIDSPEEFEERVLDYLEACHEVGEPVTITGMSLALGFASRQSMFEYGKDPRFALPVKWAKLLCENEYEKDLRRGGGGSSIFGLKNFGWEDENTLAVTGGDGGPVRFSDLTDEELRARGSEVANRLAALGAARGSMPPVAVGSSGNGKPGGNGKKSGGNGTRHADGD